METDTELSLERKGQDLYLTPKNIKHTETMIFMHGLGDTAKGWLDYFQELESSPMKSTTKVVLLTAPQLPVKINGNMKMNSWYDVKTRNLTPDTKFEDINSVSDIEESTKRIVEVIEKEIEYLGGDSKRVFVGGFSQGCAMALHVGLSFPKPLGGIMGYSGYLFPITDFNKENYQTPVFISHAKDDQVITIKRAQDSYERLKKDPNNSERKITEIYPQKMGHSINYSVISGSKEWFNLATK